MPSEDALQIVVEAEVHAYMPRRWAFPWLRRFCRWLLWTKHETPEGFGDGSIITQHTRVIS